MSKQGILIAITVVTAVITVGILLYVIQLSQSHGPRNDPASSSAPTDPTNPKSAQGGSRQLDTSEGVAESRYPAFSAYSYLAMERPSTAQMLELIDRYPGIVDEFENDPDRWLWQASKLGNVDAVVALLARGAKPRASDLEVAVVNDHIEVVKELWRARVRSDRAVAWAGGRESPDILAYMLGNGADINTRDPIMGWTALHYAAENNSPRTAEFAIQFGAEINVTGKFGFTPLDRALTQGNASLASLLKANGGRYGPGPSGKDN